MEYSPARVALLSGSFHAEDISRMRAEAVHVCSQLRMEVVDDVSVPGSMEKPLAAKRLLLRDDIDGLIVLGIIERGETGHGLVMAQAVIPALIQLQLETNKPMGTGILGPEILPKDIEKRLLPYAGAAAHALRVML